jgi:hypothetical protein
MGATISNAALTLYIVNKEELATPAWGKSNNYAIAIEV